MFQDCEEQLNIRLFEAFCENLYPERRALGQELLEEQLLIIGRAIFAINAYVTENTGPSVRPPIRKVFLPAGELIRVRWNEGGVVKLGSPRVHLCRKTLDWVPKDAGDGRVFGSVVSL